MKMPDFLKIVHCGQMTDAEVALLGLDNLGLSDKTAADLFPHIHEPLGCNSAISQLQQLLLLRAKMVSHRSWWLFILMPVKLA